MRREFYFKLGQVHRCRYPSVNVSELQQCGQNQTQTAHYSRSWHELQTFCCPLERMRCFIEKTIYLMFLMIEFPLAYRNIPVKTKSLFHFLLVTAFHKVILDILSGRLFIVWRIRVLSTSQLCQELLRVIQQWGVITLELRVKLQDRRGRVRFNATRKLLCQTICCLESTTNWMFSPGVQKQIILNSSK